MHIEVQVALNFVISYLYNKLPRRRVNIFGEELEKALKDKFQGHWYPEKPFKVRFFIHIILLILCTLYVRTQLLLILSASRPFLAMGTQWKKECTSLSQLMKLSVPRKFADRSNSHDFVFLFFFNGSTNFNLDWSKKKMGGPH